MNQIEIIQELHLTVNIKKAKKKYHKKGMSTLNIRVLISFA